MSKIKNEIMWEDEDTGFDELTSSSDRSSEFETLLDQESESEDVFYQKGERLTGTITKIPTSGDVLIELDKKNSALMALDEFNAHFSNLKVGDQISAFFTSYTDGAMILEHSLSSKANSGRALEDAFNLKVPVKGKVTGKNKGGFEVSLLGKKAFCPISQIDTKFVENQDEYLTQDLEFIITKFSGRDIVVSRRELLLLKEKESLLKLESSWAENPIVEGHVSEIKDFGLMIEIAGVKGLCHISEISHQRVSHPGEKYKVGDRVKAKVIEFDNSSNRPKISLSIKQAEKDPWEDVGEFLKDGESVSGTVTRLADFGAFVDLKAGLEGLIHISEMSWEKRIHHPKDVVNIGDTVEVRILSIDPLKQRISLTMKSVESDPWNSVKEQYKINNEYEATVVSLKGFGAFADLADGVTGFIPLKTLQKHFGAQYRKEASPPKKITVKISSIDFDAKKILFSLGSIESEDINTDSYKDYLANSKNQNSKSSSDTAQGGLGSILADAIEKKSKKT